ncbi:cytochrome P450 [Amycolatopsis sp. NPDC059021]|uniref:cytochrome P450 family protein n=1 Tax=Amycolatopsis sp. NPDC059021 TaxID=3346704 RepID=UPI00366D329C
MTGAALPEIDVSDAQVLLDPFAAYREARERAPLARLLVPGMGEMWAVTRHEEARAMLGDARFELNSGSYLTPPGIPEDCKAYLRTMQEKDGPEHTRLRGLVAPAFTARRALAFRPKMERIVEALLDTLPVSGPVDLLRDFAKPLPMDVICELVGVPAADRPQWREYGSMVASGFGKGFVEAIPAIMAGAKAVVAERRREPADDLVSELIGVQAEDGDRLSDVELVTLVWHLVLAGQTPANLIANGVVALFEHPEQLAALRADDGLAPGAVDELMRWCGPQLLTTPRFPAEDVEFGGTVIPRGTAVTAAIVSANRDPRVFADPDRLDITRAGAAAHLGFAYGPHFCLAAALARVQAEVALTGLFRRFPKLAPEGEPHRTPDPGTWRLGALPVTL